MAHLRGRFPHAPGTNSFNFIGFLGKFGKIVCWRPLESWRPHLGEILDPPLLSTKSCLKTAKPLLDTGQAHLIQTRLIRSSTLFEVSVKTLPDSYHFMFKMHG